MSAIQSKPKKTPQKRRKTAKPAPKKAQDAPKGTQFVTKFQPTEEHKNLVILASAHGYKEARIAELIVNPQTGRPITCKTLRENFRHQLDHGRDIVLMKIGGTLVSVATDRQHKGCVPAAIWLQKVWGRMRDPEPEWAENKRLAEQREAETETGDIIIEAELVLEEPKALPPPEVTLQ